MLIDLCEPVMRVSRLGIHARADLGFAQRILPALDPAIGLSQLAMRSCIVRKRFRRGVQIAHDFFSMGSVVSRIVTMKTKGGAIELNLCRARMRAAVVASR